MATTVCKACGKTIDDEFNLCPYCGTKVNKCPSCGKRLEDGFKLCPYCGVTLGAAILPQSDGLFDFGSEDVSALDIEAGLDRQLALQEKEELARVYLIRKKYAEAKAIYEERLTQNPTDAFAYVGLIRVESKNYTVFEGANIDEAIRVAKEISRTQNLAEFDADYAAYDAKRKKYFADKKAEQLRLAEEKRKAEEARIAEEKRKAEAAKKAEEARKAEEKRKAEAAKKAEEAKNLAERQKFLATWEISGTTLKKYKGKDSKVVIPKEVTVIYTEAFSGNKTLTSVVIPATVTTIGKRAFSGCENLTSVTLSNGLKIIGEEAFLYCKKLQSIVLPNSVTTVFRGAFKYCESLKSVALSNAMTSLSDCAFSGCSELKAVALPRSVRAVGNNAFEGCRNLQAVELGNVATIGDFAFADCSCLKSVSLPESVVSVGDCAFADCDALTTIWNRSSREFKTLNSLPKQVRVIRRF